MVLSVASEILPSITNLGPLSEHETRAHKTKMVNRFRNIFIINSIKYLLFFICNDRYTLYLCKGDQGKQPVHSKTIKRSKTLNKILCKYMNKKY